MSHHRFLARRGHTECPSDSAFGVREPVGVRDRTHGRLGYVDEIEVYIGVRQGLEECAKNFRGRAHTQPSDGHPAHLAVVLQTLKTNCSFFSIQHRQGGARVGGRHDQGNVGTRRAWASRILDNCLDVRARTREDMQDARHTVGLVRNSNNGDFRSRVDPGHSGHFGLLPCGLEEWMTVKARQDQRPRLRHEGGPHVDRNTKPAGIFNTPQMQYLAPGGRELKHFLA
jgi:hypothetical protein